MASQTRFPDHRSEASPARQPDRRRKYGSDPASPQARRNCKAQPAVGPIPYPGDLPRLINLAGFDKAWKRSVLADVGGRNRPDGRFAQRVFWNAQLKIKKPGL